MHTKQMIAACFEQIREYVSYLDGVVVAVLHVWTARVVSGRCLFPVNNTTPFRQWKVGTKQERYDTLQHSLQRGRNAFQSSKVIKQSSGVDRIHLSDRLVTVAIVYITNQSFLRNYWRHIISFYVNDKRHIKYPMILRITNRI